MFYFTKLEPVFMFFYSLNATHHLTQKANKALGKNNKALIYHKPTKTPQTSDAFWVHIDVICF